MSYTPVPAELRKYKGPKWEGREGQWVGSHWFTPLEFLRYDDRKFPETRPDDEGLLHKWWCECKICSRPAVQARKQRELQNRRKRQTRSERSTSTEST